MDFWNAYPFIIYIVTVYFWSLKDETAEDVRDRFLGTGIITLVLYRILG